jgi:hypothetical protein
VLLDSYHTGWPTTALALSGTTPQLTAGPRNAERFRPYNSLDLRITRTFTLPRGVLDVYAEVSNVTSRDNPCCTQYSIERGSAGERVLRVEEDHWLPTVPSIGVLWRY